MSLTESELIHDWNLASGEELRPGRGPVQLDDETLRDGLQSPSVIDPSLETKVELLHLMERLGIETADITTFGEMCTPEVEAALPRAIEAVLTALDEERNES